MQETESWNESEKEIDEGGPGSGRYPAGSSGGGKNPRPSADQRDAAAFGYRMDIKKGVSKDKATKDYHTTMARHYGAQTVDEYIARAERSGEPATGGLTGPGNKVSHDIATIKKALKGYKYKKEENETQDNEEADTASANTQFLRDEKKKESSKKHINIGFKPKLKEAQKTKGARRYEVVLIQEGLGNLKDAFYYSPQAIHSAVQVFEGCKIYANHPGPNEEYEHPERTVEKIIGHMENLKSVKSDDGRLLCVGDAVILEGSHSEWADVLLSHSVNYKKRFSDKDFIGFSINASGDSEEQDAQKVLRSAPQSAQGKIQEAINMGNEKIRVVIEITECVSCDLVTQAGAGGRVLKILEEDKMKKTKTKEADQEAPPAGGDKDKPHDDEAQDKALIADMIKKHMGDKEVSEADMGGISENVEAYKETGMEADEAVKHACSEYKKEAIKKEKKENQEAGEKPPVEEKKKEAAMKIDSNLKEAEAIKLTARVAVLESELKKARLEKYVDQKLEESKISRQASKKFLERCKGEFANEKDFDLKLSIYLEALKEAQSGTYITGNEKTAGGEADGSMSLADCVTE